MINLAHEVTPGKPRRGREQVEYAWVKMEIVEAMNAETPDKEIAARLNLSSSGFYRLKRRILHESIDLTMAQNVAAREYMRLVHQEEQLIKYMNDCWAADTPPQAPYITAFTNLSKRIADLLGANAAVAVTVEEIDGERSAQIRRDQHEQARDLRAYYEFARRMAMTGVGSGLTDDELERELGNIRVELESAGGSDISSDGDGSGDGDGTVTDAEIVNETYVDTSPAADTDLTLIDTEGYSDDDWDVHGGELVTLPSLTRDEKLALIREVAGGHGDQETPGRWVAGKFVSWWHDSGDASPEDFEYDDMWPNGDDVLGNELDGPPADD